MGAWGGPFCNLVFKWMNLVEWPQSPDISTGDPGVSWMELALSFVAWSQVVVPLKRMRPRSKGEYLQTFSSWSQMELHKVGLGELSNTFSILISQIRRLHGYDPCPARSHGFVKSVFLLGSRVQSYGVRQRPAFPKQAVISAYLHDFVRKFEKFDTLVEIPGINLTLGDIGKPPAYWNTSLKNVAKGYQMAG